MVYGDRQQGVYWPCGVKDPEHAWTLYVREPGDLSGIRQKIQLADRSGKVCDRNPGAHATEKSDIGVVPEKVPNKIGEPIVEVLEERPMTKGNSGETAVNCTQRQGETLNGLDRIGEAAKGDKALRFTSLMHHITVDKLRDAYLALKRDAAPGLDNVTWRQYGEKLEEHLSSLYQAVQSGRYRATPSKRIWV
jgi:hypothetical protein